MSEEVTRKRHGHLTDKDKAKLRKMLLANVDDDEICLVMGISKITVNRYKWAWHMSAKWTEGEKQFVFDNYDKMSCQEMAEALGRTSKAVQGYLSRCDSIKPRKCVEWKMSDLKWLKKNYPLGITKCALHLGRSREAVAKKMLALGV